jgi:hypothetical protein
MTPLSFDSGVLMTPLSLDSGVTGHLNLGYLCKLATFFAYILGSKGENLVRLSL